MQYSNASGLLKSWFFLLPFAGDWNYENTDLRPSINPECGGYQQSPIALDTWRSYVHNYVHLHFYNYGIPLSTPIEVVNNGYTADVDIKTTENNNMPYVTISGLHDYFEVQGLHFHWGSQTSAGSEHTIDGKQYDLEMHIVHKNSKYSTVEKARNYPDGLLVLGVLFKAVPYLESAHHSTLIEVFNSLDSITKYNTSTELDGEMTLGSFLPDVDINKFFTYQGSLTTPPCSESVFWFVFQDIVPISFENLKKFWNMLDKDGAPLVNNFREVQKSISPVYRKSYRYYEF